MARNLLGTLKRDEREFECVNWRVFPPKEVFAYGPDPLASRTHVDPIRYEQIKSWSRACGLMKMSDDKCWECPHLRASDGLEHSYGPGGFKAVAPHTAKAKEPVLNTRKRMLRKKFK